MRMMPLTFLAAIPLTVFAVWILPDVLGRHEGWSEGSRHGPWTVQFTGYGTVSGNDLGEVTLAPAAAESPDITHGALVLGDQSLGDLHFTITVDTTSQIRTALEPNPWEVGWVLWHFTDQDHFYAFVAKPNGWELSKQDPHFRGKQRFLASGSQPVFAVGTAHTVEVTQVGSTIKIVGDGAQLTTFTDMERPYLTGTIALYAEDAVATFSALTLHPTPTDGPTP